ncbi:PREDICTED: uncharacterized protein LOC105519508 [Colobus angolensis palliatus]|uniref:uncharacterized protein LOC105519508 n=1 Tax=Colobus angolensis palliatus TaxID=336983 RepID=UPI0005F4326C|nr:PREDICTED: uncharacterized protein LOC105519508 [Colobus angolensis palliatus]
MPVTLDKTSSISVTTSKMPLVLCKQVALRRGCAGAGGGGPAVPEFNNYYGSAAPASGGPGGRAGPCFDQHGGQQSPGMGMMHSASAAAAGAPGSMDPLQNSHEGYPNSQCNHYPGYSRPGAGGGGPGTSPVRVLRVRRSNANEVDNSCSSSPAPSHAMLGPIGSASRVFTHIRVREEKRKVSFKPELKTFTMKAHSGSRPRA